MRTGLERSDFLTDNVQLEPLKRRPRSCFLPIDQNLPKRILGYSQLHREPAPVVRWPSGLSHCSNGTNGPNGPLCPTLPYWQRAESLARPTSAIRLRSATMSTLARNDSVISAAIVLVSVVECRALVILIACVLRRVVFRHRWLVLCL